MLGTIPQLDEHYEKGGSGLAAWIQSCFQRNFWLDSTVMDIFDMYGSSYSKQEISALLEKSRGEHIEADDNNRAVHDVEAGEEPGHEHDDILDWMRKCTGEWDDFVLQPRLLASALSDSGFPDPHESWSDQLINIADNGDFYRGKLVYLAVRVGLFAQKNPFPSDIAAVVIAASAASLKGSWTLMDATSVKTVREGGNDKVTDWNDQHRVYVVLPRNCMLGPGVTGRVACTAYGIGWIRDKRLENYEDVLLEANEVLVSAAGKVRSGIVAVLMCSIIFLVDKGHQIGLTGWSGVLSVLAQYQADHVYNSKATVEAITAIRSGQANYASDRDLPGSSVPVIWFPLLALAAEVSSSNTILGACICLVTCSILLKAHLHKLLGYGFSDSDVLSRAIILLAMVVLYPLTYRIFFYFAYVNMISQSFIMFVRNTTFRILYLFLYQVVFLMFVLMEIIFTAKRYSWDPSPTSTLLTAKWMFAWWSSISSIYLFVENNGYRSTSKVDDKHEPYTLSGWSHRQQGGNKASRYIVEYGSEAVGGESTLGDDTKWSN